MKSKKLEIEIPEGKTAVWRNGVLTLIDEPEKEVRERIKTFEDACREIGIDAEAWNRDKISLGLEEEKSRVVYRSNNNAYALGGVSCAYANYDSSFTNAHIGVRLAFKTSELAAYCGRQFLDIWADFVFLPEEKSE